MKLEFRLSLTAALLLGITGFRPTFAQDLPSVKRPPLIQSFGRIDQNEKPVLPLDLVSLVESVPNPPQAYRDEITSAALKYPEIQIKKEPVFLYTYWFLNASDQAYQISIPLGDYSDDSETKDWQQPLLSFLEAVQGFHFEIPAQSARKIQFMILGQPKSIIASIHLGVRSKITEPFQYGLAYLFSLYASSWPSIPRGYPGTSESIPLKNVPQEIQAYFHERFK